MSQTVNRALIAATMLAERPMTRDEVQRATGWTPKQTERALSLVSQGVGRYDRRDGRYHLHSAARAAMGGRN